VIPILRETRVRDNVWVWTLGEDRIETSYGANCTAVVGRDSVLVVDPFIAPALAKLVEDALREKTSLPVRFVVLTHHHTDHALGAGWFARRGATVGSAALTEV
jgi:glyoxylase-like metal-dependent hydrolase (beta-lactamase superfamily II)